MHLWIKWVRWICFSVWLYEGSLAVSLAEIRLILLKAHLRYTAGGGDVNSISVTISARQGWWRSVCFAGLCLFRMHIYLLSLVKCLSCQELCDPKLSGVRRAGGSAFCSSAVLKVRVSEWISLVIHVSFIPPDRREHLFFLVKKQICFKEQNVTV